MKPPPHKSDPLPAAGRRRLKITATTAALSVLLLLCLGATNSPVGFRYIKTGEFNNRGYISYGTTFWATNHTTNTLILTLTGIEVKAGANWVAFPSPIQPLDFRLRGQPLSQTQLKAHEAGYATVQLSPQPTGQVWRAQVQVQPVLHGLAETEARLKTYPRRVEARVRTGNTNLSLNPFQQNMTFLGEPTEILSQEISDK